MFMKEINYLEFYGKKVYHAKMARYTDYRYAEAMEVASEEAFYAAAQRVKNQKLTRSQVQRWGNKVEKGNPSDENLRNRYPADEKAAEQKTSEIHSSLYEDRDFGLEQYRPAYEAPITTTCPTPVKADAKWPKILATLDRSAATLSAKDLDRIDGLPHKEVSYNHKGSAYCNMASGQSASSHRPMTKAQIRFYKAMLAETRKFQDECDDARWAKETPEEYEHIRSILRERNNIYPGDDVERTNNCPNLWGVPIGTVFPCPDWEQPYEDEEYKKKLAIARMLPTIRPELYVPGHNVYAHYPPLNPRVKAHYFPDAPPDIMPPAPEDSGDEEDAAPIKLPPRTFAVLKRPDYCYPDDLAARIVPATPYGFPTGGRLSPQEQTYGHRDNNGTFHPVPAMPTPERVQELEERKRNEPRELPSPIISRLRQSTSLYGTDSGSPAPQPKSILCNNAFKAYLISEEDLTSVITGVNTDTRYEVNTSADDEILYAENNISETQLKPAVRAASLTKRSSILNMKNSVPTDNMDGLVKETNITSDKDVAKKKGTFYNLKESFSITKLNQPLLHTGTRDNTASINKDSSHTGVEQSSSITKPKKPMVSFDTTPKKAETEKKSCFKGFMRSLSPRKRSDTVTQTKEAYMLTDTNTASVQIFEDGLPVDADGFKTSTVEPICITVAKSTKNGGLREHVRKLRNNNAGDRFAEDISFGFESDEEHENALSSLAKAGITDTKSSKKQKNPQAQEGSRYPAIYTATGVRLDGSIAAAYPGMGQLNRSNSTAQGLEARKLAEVDDVDNERSEAERYMARAMGRGRPLPDAALSTHITTEKEKAGARALREGTHMEPEDKERVEKGGDKLEEDNQAVETSPPVASARLPEDKSTVRARMEFYPSS